jgi:hypothetical protein
MEAAEDYKQKADAFSSAITRALDVNEEPEQLQQGPSAAVTSSSSSSDTAGQQAAQAPHSAERGRQEELGALRWVHCYTSHRPV